MRLDEEQKKRLHKVLLVTGGGCLLLLAYALFVNVFGFGLPCIYKQTLGLDCAGCGLSRAAAALVRLDFRAAFAYNAVWPLYLGYILWAVPTAVTPYVKYGHSINFPRPVWLNWVIFGLILAYGAVRNFI
ncbi:MAG: DUF2752 domain-containing protein [Clostridia bacterium]|nr:DUF2752 domain-containing protein [Clostridia bacterium]